MSDEDDSFGFGTWQWGVTALVVLLTLAGLGYAFFGGSRVDHLFGVDVEQLFESYVTDSAQPFGFTSEGIFRAVETAGWSAEGDPGAIQTDGRRAVVQQFSKDGRRLVVRIVSLESSGAASKYEESIELPRRALQFETKVAVIDARGSAGDEEVGSVLQRLQRYRRMVESREN